MSSSRLEDLSDKILDDVTAQTIAESPSLRIIFLASLGPRLRSSAIRVLFRCLLLSDDAAAFTSPDTNIAPILSNPARYAHEVKIVRVHDARASTACRAQRSCSGSSSSSGSETNAVRPLDADQITALLRLCGNLDEFVWESSAVPPDGLCEILGSNNHLSRFSYVPWSPLRTLRNQSARSALPKWNCPSLPLLSPLLVTTLSLTRLSQCGARALSTLLLNLGEGSFLEDLTIDFVWLDDSLCEAIAEAGRRMRRLKIGTTGTKLTDKGVCAIIEGCDSLEDFVLEEVQGRLSRSLWTKPSHYPQNLRRFTAAINEIGPHHSWTTDHLLSVHALPMQSLDALFVVRREPPPRLERGVPVYDPVTDDVVALKPVPEKFVDSIRDARALTVFECDWWAWSVADLKVLLESCPNLVRLKLCLNAPFSKLLNLTSNFASLANLRTLSVSINPAHAPGKPPAPRIPTARSSLPTPTESPVIKSKSVLPQLLDFDQMQTHPGLPATAADATDDPSMPLLRDVKRFVRKCARLETLHWYGNAGRGSWRIARPAQTAKNSINISIEYASPTISTDVWSTLLGEQENEEASKAGRGLVVLERVGQAWTGEVAEAMAAAAEKEREDSALSSEKDRAGQQRDGHKKAKPSSVSTLWSTSGGADNPSPTGSYTQSPDQQTFSQLTPPNSEASLSAILPAPAPESAWPPPDDAPDARPQLSRKRTPSEPGPNVNGRLSNGRSRSATVALNGGSNHHHHHHAPSASSAAARGSGVPGSAAGGGRGSSSRSGRGRGTSGGKSDKQQQNGASSASRAGNAPAATAPTRGRGARRGNHASSSSSATGPRNGKTGFPSQ